MLEPGGGGELPGRRAEITMPPGAVRSEAVAPAGHVAIGTVRLGQAPTATVQAARDRNRPAEVPASGVPAVRAPGMPLDQDARRLFEADFGADFGAVRVYPDDPSARDLAARAYTIGEHVVFAPGQYRPAEREGRRLLAHELSHVVQQRARPGVTPGAQASVTMPASADEREAEDVADRVLADGAVHPGQAPTAAVQRQLITPLGQRGGFGGLLEHPRQPAAGDARPSPGEARQPTEGPTIRQAPIGEVILELPDWDFLPTRTWNKPLFNKSAEVPLLEVPIPELGVRVDVLASADASAIVGASYGGALRNIHAGLTYAQYTELMLLSHPLDPIAFPLPLPRSLAGLAGLVREFRALADLDVSGHVEVQIRAGANLHAAASALGLFEVAHVGAGFDAHASAGAELRFRDRIGIYCEKGDFDFRDAKSLQLSFNLAFNLDAYLEAGLLGFRWHKPWRLADFHLNRLWAIGADLDVDYHSAGNQVTTINVAEEALAAIDFVKQLIGAAPDTATLTPLNPSGPGGPVGPGGPAAPGGTPPRGRTKADPIPMTWYKPPGLYPPSITLSGERYFLTEPAWLPVPAERGLSDVRRHAGTDETGNPAIRIGVAPGSKYYPLLRSIWPRVESGVLRSGTRQNQFRRLLAAHGFNWGTYEADHVRDLQWAGADAYNNLWPLERAHNNAANDVLNQPVDYTDTHGVARIGVPLRTTPLGLYFRIDDYA